MHSMNQYVFGGLCLTLGLALGVSLPIPPAKVPERGNENYVRLKALHGLCNDYKREKGAYPVSMAELEIWSADLESNQKILEGSRRLHLGHDQAFKEWQIVGGTNASPNAPLISSGTIPHAGAPDGYEIVINAVGRISNLRAAGTP
jgi:hypothetical protein